MLIFIPSFFLHPTIPLFSEREKSRGSSYWMLAREERAKRGGPMALRHSHSPTIVSRVFISSRCIFVQLYTTLPRSLARCFVRSLSPVLALTCPTRYSTYLCSSRSRLVSFFFLFFTSLPRRNGSNYYARNAETAWDKRDAILIGLYLFPSIPTSVSLKCWTTCRQLFA